MPHDPSPEHRRGAGPDRAADAVGPKVRFVGAGPGPADLMTLRAAAALRDADVVVHDLLVHPSVLAEASADAEIVPVSTASGMISSSAADESGDAGRRTGLFLRELALAGRRVVRLKGGDPTVFARLAEEMSPLVEAGISVEVVPGVTAALAASASAAIPLTSRTHASSLTLVTGHRAGGGGAASDLATLAILPGSLVFYMGVERLEDWSGELIAAGRAGDTPVVIVSRCGWHDETILSTTLAAAAADAAAASMPSPAVAIVGEVVREGRVRPPAVDPRACREPAPDCGPDRPLSGRTILLVRPAGQSAELSRLFQSRGAETVECPAVRIEPPESWKPLDDAIDAAGSFDWIVFTSANGVRSFVDRLRQRGLDARSLGTARMAAVGPKTVESLAAAGLACDLSPREAHHAEALAAALEDGPPRRRFLLVRADRGRDLLAGRLAAAGHGVVDVVGYRTADVEAVEPERMMHLRRRPPDWMVVTSPAVAAAGLRLFGEFYPRMRVATISPLTSEAVRRLGFEPAAEAAQATPEAIVDAVVAAAKSAPFPSRTASA